VTTPGSSPSPRLDRRTELLREGWAERFAAAPPRLDEAIEVFRAAGLEVRIEPAAPGAGAAGCAGCEPALRGMAMIWVRRPR